jgi:hypothetical protein
MSNHIIDAGLFQAVFQMIEKDNEDNRLFSRLEKKAIIKMTAPNTISIVFNCGVYAEIVNELDVFYLHTLLEGVYCNEEDCFTKMSVDRVIFYLNRILDLIMYGR